MPSSTQYTVLEEADVYKATTNSDLVVVRRLRLFREGKFLTFHDYQKDINNKKSWYLDRKCELSPKYANEILQPVRKTERPQGTWTITATVTGSGNPVSLYLFEVTWPLSWASKGYTTFTLGFEKIEDARRWHDNFNSAINYLKNISARKKGHFANPSSDAMSSASFSPPSASAVSAMFGSDSGHVSQHQYGAPRSGPTDLGTLQETMSVVTAADDPEKYYEAPLRGGDALIDDSDDEAHAATPHTAASRTRRTNGLGERWVPYKQTNGVAIYHQDDPESCFGLGGEYLVSSVVRGSPQDVLDVLMHTSSHTTILGPATKSEVLECTQHNEETKELLRMTLEAPGWAGRMCAPRSLLVRRVKKEDEGVYVVMFSSVDESTATRNCKAEGAPVTEAGQTVQVRAMAAERKPRSWFKRPVPCRVDGGYTVAPLLDYSLDSSPETLLTCIIKVDLGGVCSDCSWLRPFADLMGWTDAFLDRMLMTVMLVRDAVEHSRFKEPPFLVATNSQALPLAAESFTPGAEKQPSAASAGRLRPPAFSKMSSCLRERSVFNTQLKDELSKRLLSNQVSLGALPEASSEGPEPVLFTLEAMKAKSTLETRFWDEIHVEGKDAPFVVRGPTYLKDRKKLPAGQTVFTFASMDVVTLPHPVEHVARFLPAVRQSGVPFAIIINLIIPGTPLLGIVATFVTDKHPDILGTPPKHPMEEDHDWEPFDFVLHKYINGDDQTRNLMLKLIPHIAAGSWMIKQSVGTTPVILGKALKTTYHVTKQYIEIDIDVSANNVAAYVTGLVRGATKSLVIDMGFVLEGTAPWELPEALLGALRLNYLDLKYAKPLDISREIPLTPAMKFAPAPPPERVNTGNLSKTPSVSRVMHSRNNSTVPAAAPTSPTRAEATPFAAAPAPSSFEAVGSLRKDKEV
mmetsp:Transcript_6312/g.13904  ORF Transcript_6312/g.13904 Transcript_6312/m.13904 type:complete len:915 (+) Transcript_6312:68-2812(+)|eukprot:CAMPEP_0202900526 /NCGR_PEP_ID=MMETSP1392-20130828/11884_1 /ASSEMBLY_ACC=CAM_ASM_000868 /TAXON_ID=225041 /ORGANISM="Chlamydomonas chlamydogama, Strain SAG 11-48b" /LENGTH=914 /DNA_ID=CAMNT_0049586931 /DNA_START=67 /DNA_END=2811 /DNA_ORIENTATION=-